MPAQKIQKAESTKKGVYVKKYNLVKYSTTYWFMTLVSL